VVIAIDGPGGVGKSTVARAVADVLALPYLDTGATYRAATLAVLRAGVEPGDEDAILEVIGGVGYEDRTILLDGDDVAADVRSPDVTATVSEVSAHPRVRHQIVDLQRRWVEQHGGSAVVEGRDIGTVVFPDATVKVFLTARPGIRAARRAGDAEAAGSSIQAIADALRARDEADASRATSPMRPADDAHIIDTSDATIGDVIDAVVALVPRPTAD
jgi:cytidylate kinase